MKRKVLRLLRNFRDHFRFFHKHPPKGDVCCSRCANIWCRRNITPTALLPKKENQQGKIRQQTCSEFIRDSLLPVDLGN
ncbi:MAG: hypothetical protein NTZ49_02130 [Candidatus Parcubacteria bacterium]|nr:hypothetical protein [Candidatus Parcubacteria bacterium]